MSAMPHESHTVPLCGAVHKVGNETIACMFPRDHSGPHWAVSSGWGGALALAWVDADAAHPDAAEAGE